MIRCLILGFLLGASLALGASPLSYRSGITSPVGLLAPDGSRLEKGQYDIEVKVADGRYDLVWLRNDRPVASINGEVLKDDAIAPRAARLLIGTLYLRSSADPVGTEAERHFSKTGFPQYEEENRDWKAAMRVYGSLDGKQAVFLFSERQLGEQWNRVVFRLAVAPPAL